MKKAIVFLVISCFYLSITVLAESDLSRVGKKFRSFTKESRKGIAELSEEEFEALVDDVIEISLKEFERDFGDLPNYTPVSQEEKEAGKQEVMKLIRANPELLEESRDETGEITAKNLVETLNNYSKKETKETYLIVAQGNIAMLETSLALYELDNGFYPSTSQGLLALLEKPTSGPTPTAWNGPYLPKMIEDPWENSYHYVYPGIHNKDKFDISSYGPDEVESDDDINNWD